jgi:nitrate/nitrite transporter NarK
MTAVRLLPLGVAAFPIAPIVQNMMQTGVQPKKIFIVSLMLMFVATILFPFADTRDRYWPLLFIGMTIGTVAAMSNYIASRLVCSLFSLISY